MTSFTRPVGRVPSTMMFLRFALLSAAVIPAAFAAAEPADAPAREAALARDLSRAQAALQETREALAKQSAEIAAVRAESAATRIQLGKAQAEAAAGRITPSSLPSTEAPAALERERTAHLATKAVLAQRESQVQDLAAERTKLESEIRVLRASSELAKTNATAETKTILGQNVDLAARSAVLARDLNSAKSEITTVRHELREQGAKAATAAEALNNQLAASQNSLAATRAELREARTALESAAKPTPADLAAMQIQERQLAALEKELTATRTELAQAKSALESALVNAAKPGAAAEAEAQLLALRETNASLRRELAATTAAARMQDRPTITEGELTLLRDRAATARDLEQRVQQLEAEKAAAMAHRDAPAGDELARLEAARAAAESKLNTVLRSYTLLARERDALRDPVQSRSTASNRPVPATAAADQPTPAFQTEPAALTAAPAPARTAPRSYPAPRPVSFGGPEDPVPVLTVTRVAQPRPAPPGSVPLGQPAFSHRIAPGETLASIARRYYGNPKRWPEIVAANRDVLPDQRSFAAGKMIRIP